MLLIKTFFSYFLGHWKTPTPSPQIGGLDLCGPIGLNLIVSVRGWGLFDIPMKKPNYTSYCSFCNRGILWGSKCPCHGLCNELDKPVHEPATCARKLSLPPEIVNSPRFLDLFYLNYKITIFWRSYPKKFCWHVFFSKSQRTSKSRFKTQLCFVWFHCNFFNPSSQSILSLRLNRGLPQGHFQPFAEKLIHGDG